MPGKFWRIFLLGIALPVLLMACTCKEVQVAAKGDTVQVDYTGTLSDGTQFDSSVGKDPLEFTLGTGAVITGFENAILGMKVGETKTVTIPAAEAYGEYNNRAVMEISKDELAPGTLVAVGDQFQMRTTDGGVVTVRVTAISDTTFTVDANHELAGKDLTFKLTLVKIVKPE